MSKILITPRQNCKTSQWFIVKNDSDLSLDITSFAGRSNARLQMGFGETRKFGSYTIEVDPNETVLIRVAPPTGQRVWSSNQMIIIQFIYDGKDFERTFITSSRGKIGHFITTRNPDKFHESREKTEDEKDEKDDDQDDDQDDDHDGESREKTEDEKDKDEYQAKDVDGQDSVDLQVMQETLSNYSKLRAKVDNGKTTISTLRETFNESKKRLLEAETKLKKEEAELKDATEICQTIEQQFKKIKSAMEKK